MSNSELLFWDCSCLFYTFILYTLLHQLYFLYHLVNKYIYIYICAIHHIIKEISRKHLQQTATRPLEKQDIRNVLNLMNYVWIALLLLPQ